MLAVDEGQRVGTGAATGGQARHVVGSGAGEVLAESGVPSAVEWREVARTTPAAVRTVTCQRAWSGDATSSSSSSGSPASTSIGSAMGSAMWLRSSRSAATGELEIEMPSTSSAENQPATPWTIPARSMGRVAVPRIFVLAGSPGSTEATATGGPSRSSAEQVRK